MDIYNVLKRCKGILLTVGWLAALLATPTTVWAECLDTPNQEFNVLIDASSSCSALSSNMVGCTTDSAGSCVIENPDESGEDIHIQVTPMDAVGKVPSAPGYVSWEVTRSPSRLIGSSVDFLISVGATGGGTCGWSFTPGRDSDTGAAFLKSNGSAQKVNDLFFCSDFTGPPPENARVLINKTVMISGGTCGVDDVEVLDVGVGTQVEYCFVLENVGIGWAGGVTLIDSDATISNTVDGSIEPGAPPLTVKSDPVTISEVGELVNTATVTWINSNTPDQDTGESSDTAKVISEQVLVVCPSEYQNLVNDAAQAGDGFNWAALLDPDNPDQVSVCVPTGGDAGEATRTPCNFECVPNPDYPDECVFGEVCEPCLTSGAWGNGLEGCPNDAPEGTDPYCWEVIQDHDKNCTYEPVDPLTGYEFSIMLHQRNPFCYLSCTGSGKKKRCEEICF